MSGSFFMAAIPVCGTSFTLDRLANPSGYQAIFLVPRVGKCLEHLSHLVISNSNRP